MGGGKPSASSFGKLSILSHQRLREVCANHIPTGCVFSHTLRFPVISFQKQSRDVETLRLISAVFSQNSLIILMQP